MRSLIKWVRAYINKTKNDNNKKAYFKKGQIPWSRGYGIVRQDLIYKSIYNEKFNIDISNRKLPKDYGFRIDERIVELPWLLAKMSEGEGSLLDAGSSLNYDYIIDHPKVKNKKITIYTYSPEYCNYNERGISYIYGDLRSMPFKDNLFDQIACISTLEHIDMDNSMYGYQIPNNGWSNEKSFEFLKAVKELIRILKPGGKLFITVPYGKFENHGFFQQFDEELVHRMKEVLQSSGNVVEDYFQYVEGCWQFSNSESCRNSISFNPHTNVGKLDDGAAHCRAICSLIIIKK